MNGHFQEQQQRFMDLDPEVLSQDGQVPAAPQDDNQWVAWRLGQILRPEEMPLPDREFTAQMTAQGLRYVRKRQALEIEMKGFELEETLLQDKLLMQARIRRRRDGVPVMLPIVLALGAGILIATMVLNNLFN